MKGTIYDDESTFYLSRQDMPGMEKVLKIRDFLCFFCNFTNDLPIFSESWTCNYLELNNAKLFLFKLLHDGKRQHG